MKDNSSALQRMQTALEEGQTKESIKRAILNHLSVTLQHVENKNITLLSVFRLPFPGEHILKQFHEEYPVDCRDFDIYSVQIKYQGFEYTYYAAKKPNSNSNDAFKLVRKTHVMRHRPALRSKVNRERK